MTYGRVWTSKLIWSSSASSFISLYFHISVSLFQNLAEKDFQSFQFFLSVRDIFSMLQGIHAWTAYMRGSSTLYCLIFCDDSWRDQQTNIWAAEVRLDAVQVDLVHI